MDEIFASEPDCPNCGTRTIATKGGIYVYRACKLPVHPAIGL
ncbi:hypothetical protein [Agromyces sp. NPDC058104]